MSRIFRAAPREIVDGAQAVLNAARDVQAGTQQIAAAAQEASSAAAEAATASRQQSRGAEDLAAAIEEVASLADAWREADAWRRPSGPARREQSLRFIVAGAAYALLAEAVLEVVRKPAITRVPHAPAGLAGPMNFHGTAVPAIVMSRLLGDAGPATTSAPKIIVYGEPSPVGLLVDDVLQLGIARERDTARPVDVEQLLQPPSQGWRCPGAGAAPGGRGDEDRRGRSGARAVDVPGRGPGLRAHAGGCAGGRGAAGEVAAMPRSDATVVGLFQLRDAVLPLISLAGLLGLAPGNGGRASSFGGGSADGVPIGLVAGAIEGTGASASVRSNRSPQSCNAARATPRSTP